MQGWWRTWDGGVRWRWPGGSEWTKARRKPWVKKVLYKEFSSSTFSPKKQQCLLRKEEKVQCVEEYITLWKQSFLQVIYSSTHWTFSSFLNRHCCFLEELPPKVNTNFTCSHNFYTFSLITLMGMIQSPSWFWAVPDGPYVNMVHFVILGNNKSKGSGPTWYIKTWDQQNLNKNNFREVRWFLHFFWQPLLYLFD